MAASQFYNGSYLQSEKLYLKLYASTKAQRDTFYQRIAASGVGLC
jgi:hypothetical protein